MSTATEEKPAVVEEIKDPAAVLAELRRVQEDLKAVRAENKELTARLESTDEEAVAKWRTRAIKAEAKVNLEGQGIKDADRILKYVDLEGVDFDDEGKLTGLDDKLSTIKTDFPELFDVKKRAGRNGADIHENRPAESKMSSTEAQVARIFHK